MYRTRLKWLVPVSASVWLATGCAPVVEPVEPAAESTPSDPPAKPITKSAVEPANPDLALLKVRIEAALEHVRNRDLQVTNAFWTVFHGILTFGDGLTLFDPQTGERVNALEYIFAGRFDRGEIRGMRFFPTEHGLDVQMGPTFVGQGHQDQFIAVLAQWDVPIDQQVHVFGEPYTVRDFVRQVEARVRVGQELSWSNIVLAHYLPPGTTWKNSAGEEMTLEILVQSELDADINGAACGGTHRLGGLTWVLHRHRRGGGKTDGVWEKVRDKIDAHIRLARQYQNPDGSFSCNYFISPGTKTEAREKIGSSGHTLEFLSSALPSEELRAEWMRDAAAALAAMLLETQSMPIESGALYHAAHGLVIYYERVYGFPDPPPRLTQAELDQHPRAAP